MLTGDEIQMFLAASACPKGHRYTLVMISLTKRVLAEQMPASYRVQFLDHLEKMGSQDQFITPDVISAVEPVCDKGYEMILEAQKLGAAKALDAYAEFFPAFAALNPSLMASLKLSPMYQERSEYQRRTSAMNKTR